MINISRWFRRKKARMTSPTSRIVCFFDVDNTLLDNDALKADYDHKLTALLGPEHTARFWDLYEEARRESDVVDYPATVRRLRPEIGDALADQVWDIIWNYPFADRLYPDSLTTLRHFWQLGCECAIVSDGDMVYQPHKIAASGLQAAVGDLVKIYVHKQDHLADLMQWAPGSHYVMIDDKPKILADVKRLFGARFTTIQVRQGHYADETAEPRPDLSFAAIGDVKRITLDQLAPPTA
jgi:FMN phosphatase YigB (HAD superfamily)